MSDALIQQEYWTLEDMALHLGPIEIHRHISKESFVELAERYPKLRIEREPNGIITLMSPVKKGSSRRENSLNFLLNLWNFHNSHGEVYGPNGTYDLPNGATKMPDASWISPERLENQPEEEEEYIQVVPDFVAEIRSSSDNLAKLKEKMTDSWIANGVRLAWLIDPYEEKAYIYRSGTHEPEIVENFTNNTLSGETVLPGFTLPLNTMKRKK
jgi:Uma2 family endonuclease